MRDSEVGAADPFSASITQTSPRLRVCMGGFVAVLQARRVSKISTLDDGVRPQVPICNKSILTFDLVTDPTYSRSLDGAGDHTEKRLVLVHLRSCSGADVYVRVVCPPTLHYSRGN